MRIAIYGAGGLGAYYGARLHAAGHEVGYIARGAHLDAMHAKGLQVFSPLGDVHVAQPLASNAPADIGAVDLVIVAVKTWQIPDVARAMGPLLDTDTVVIPFLNGVEAPNGLADVIGADRVLGGLSKIFALIEAPGVIRHFSQAAYVEIGEPGGGISARADRPRDGRGDRGRPCARASPRRRRQGATVGLLRRASGAGHRVDATRHHAGAPIRIGRVERRHCAFRRCTWHRHAGARVHVPHAAADGAARARGRVVALREVMQPDGRI